MLFYGKEGNLQVIREICTDDIPQLVALISGDTSAHSWGQKDFESALNSDNQICYLMENTGFILLQKVLDEAEIIMIWISPTMRGMGHGVRLLEYAINELQKHGIKNLFLEVAENNQNAIKLYQKSGFIEIGRRKDYYKTDDNCLIDAITMNLNC